MIILSEISQKSRRKKCQTNISYWKAWLRGREREIIKEFLESLILFCRHRIFHFGIFLSRQQNIFLQMWVGHLRHSQRTLRHHLSVTYRISQGFLKVKHSMLSATNYLQIKHIVFLSLPEVCSTINSTYIYVRHAKFYEVITIKHVYMHSEVYFSYQKFTTKFIHRKKAGMTASSYMYTAYFI